MGRKVRLLAVRGVDVVVDASWFFALALAIATLTTLAEHTRPTLDVSGATAWSVVAALGLFASLALSGVAHALASRRRGVPVTRVTLLLFGSITDVERDPASPRSEAVAALAAPAANLAAAGASFVIAAALLGAIPPDSTVLLRGDFGPALFSFLGAANVALAALSLVPAFPLAGGRLVRAFCWSATDDVERASRWAAWSAQVIGWLVVLGGVSLALLAHGPAVATGMWTAFVGWFLASGAAQAYEAVVAQDALAGVTVARVMRRRVRAIPANVSVAAAYRGWLSQSDEPFSVVDGERFVGSVSKKDAARIPAAAWATTSVAAIAVPDVAATPADALSSAVAVLDRRDASRVPVVDRGRLVGLIDRADVERWIDAYASRVMT